ncbi:MAG: hypothetical protein Q8N45_00080 [Anaerolineales bacterium]|nr:hypothetical protein [Anaerolineales bacterium]MDP2974586.1 hypothetical protein [Anaerolineales bacterium]
MAKYYLRKALAPLWRYRLLWRIKSRKKSVALVSATCRRPTRREVISQQKQLIATLSKLGKI